LSLTLLAGNLALQFGAARLSASTTSIIMLSEVVVASVSSVLLGTGQFVRADPGRWRPDSAGLGAGGAAAQAACTSQPVDTGRELRHFGMQPFGETMPTVYDFEAAGRRPDGCPDQFDGRVMSSSTRRAPVASRRSFPGWKPFTSLMASAAWWCWAFPATSSGQDPTATTKSPSFASSTMA
jgi:hypothetical protein